LIKGITEMGGVVMALQDEFNFGVEKPT